MDTPDRIAAARTETTMRHASDRSRIFHVFRAFRVFRRVRRRAAGGGDSG